MKTTAGLKEPFKTNIEGLLRAGGGAFWLLSGLRTYQEQYNLRVGRVPAGQELNPAYKGKPYRTAVPGTSRHETGLAADLAGNLDVAHDLAGRFNIWFPLWEQLGEEYWHAEPKVMALASDVAAPPRYRRSRRMAIAPHPNGKRVDVVVVGADGEVYHSVGNTADAALKAPYKDRLGGSAIAVDAAWVNAGELFVEIQAPNDGTQHFNLFKEGAGWGGWVKHPAAVLLAG